MSEMSGADTDSGSPSEMSEASTDGGSPDAPIGTRQLSAAGSQTAGTLEQPPLGKTSAPADGGPPPPAGVPNPAEPGRASATKSADGVQTGNSPHFDVAAALRNAGKELAEARQGRDGRPPEMLHKAWEQWRDAKPDAKATEPGKASVPADAVRLRWRAPRNRRNRGRPAHRPTRPCRAVAWAT